MKDLRYKKQYKGEDEWMEITYDQALDTVLGSYIDSPEVRSMLDTANWIPCRFSTIAVSEIKNGREMILMPGLTCVTP